MSTSDAPAKESEAGAEHEGTGFGPVGATAELARQCPALRRTRMKGIDMKEINHKALRGVAWVSNTESG